MNDNTLLLTVHNGVAIMQLNRPKALNALNLQMLEMLDEALKKMATDPNIHVIVLTSNCKKSFCAGGDIKDIYHHKNDPGYCQRYFNFEYDLNYFISQYSKPILCLWNGIVFGGGAGISVYAPYRIACEDSIFAMPETAIGLFPDVGGSWFMGRIPGFYNGLYMALTGKQIKGKDIVKAGFATHYIEKKHFPDIAQKIMSHPWNDIDYNDERAHLSPRYVIDTILSEFCITIDDDIFLSDDEQDMIDHCFTQDSMVDIVKSLKSHKNNPLCEETYHLLQQKSPFSLFLTFFALHRAQDVDLYKALEMEKTYARCCLEFGDFFEGVRAMVIDKDKKPRFREIGPKGFSMFMEDHL